MKKSLLLLLVLSSACQCGAVASEEEARIAYLGIDQVIVRALALGFDGFNAASSANIPAQTTDGDASGRIDVTGQVDQGSSTNKGMRLDIALVEFSDGPIDDPETDEEEEIQIVYATAEDAPIHSEMKLRGIPDGTLEDGTFAGTVLMDGDLKGELELNLTFSGSIEPDPDTAGGTRREAGTTRVQGTAKSANGTFNIDTTI
jgi:hypothetical protein